jgi:hypothetical protein
MPRLPASARSGAGVSSLEKHEFAAGEVENGTGGELRQSGPLGVLVHRTLRSGSSSFSINN